MFAVAGFPAWRARDAGAAHRWRLRLPGVPVAAVAVPTRRGGRATTTPSGPQSSTVRFLVGISLLIAGAGSFLTGSSLAVGEGRLIAANRPVNAGAEDPLNIDAHNSPSVARNPVDPANVVVVNRIDTPNFSCALQVSRDDAVSWKQTEIPFPQGEEVPPRCFAPDASFGADGTLHVSFVTLKGLGNVPNAGWLVSSDDGGSTLSAPRRVLGPLAFQVRLLADSERADRLHLSWLQASGTANLGFPQPGNPILSSRSDDGGATWQPPVQVNPASRQRVVAPAPAMSADGRLYVGYLDLGDDRLDYHAGHEGRGGPPYPGPWSLVMARSSDGGSTWAETVVDGGLIPIERIIAFLPPAPSLAVDGSTGRAYVGFHDGRRGSADVWLWVSEDGGTTFASATRVNDTAEDDPSSQYLPKLALAPGGRLDVVYYDRRADPGDVMNEVSLQSSSDHGRTFGPRIRLTDSPFSSRIGFGSERGLPDLGSRLGLISSNRRAVAVWSDTRSGTEASNKQDLGRAIVGFTATSAWRDPLRLGGLAVGAAGLVLWLLAVRDGSRNRGRRGSPPTAP